MPSGRERGSGLITISGPIILQIWERFLADGYTYAQPVTGDELLDCWLRVASSQKPGSQYLVSRRIIQSCIDHISPYLCENGKLAIGLDRWLHALLCSCAGKQVQMATRRLQALLKARLESVDGYLHFLEDLETSIDKHGGIARMKDLLVFICDKAMTASWRSLGADAEDLAAKAMQAAGFIGNEFISTVELLALFFGRFRTPVVLHMYDLSKGYAQSVIPNLEGIWHTGIVAYGREYFYNGRPVFERPGAGDFGEVKKSIELGFTWYKQDELHAFIHTRLAPGYTMDSYDTLQHNCCHFVDELLVFLLGIHLQDDILYQQNRLLDIPGVRLLWPAIRPMISSCNADSRKHARVVTACSSTGSGVTDNAALKMEDISQRSVKRNGGDHMPLDEFEEDLTCGSEVSTCASSLEPSRQDKDGDKNKKDAFEAILECQAQMARDIDDLLRMANERNAEVVHHMSSNASSTPGGTQKVRRSRSWTTLFSRKKSIGETTI